MKTAGPDYGLHVVARGAITLTNVSASGNTSGTNNPSGAYLDNRYSQIAAPVKVTTGWFDNNVITTGIKCTQKVWSL